MGPTSKGREIKEGRRRREREGKTGRGKGGGRVKEGRDGGRRGPRVYL